MGLHHAVVITWVGVITVTPWYCRAWHVLAGMSWLWHEEAELKRQSLWHAAVLMCPLWSHPFLVVVTLAPAESGSKNKHTCLDRVDSC